jgi:hypothetical protein
MVHGGPHFDCTVWRGSAICSLMAPQGVEEIMKTLVIAGSIGLLTSLLVFDARPGQAQMMGWDMCREGYVYEPSRNVCVHKSKQAKRPKAKTKAAK